jgi:Galactose oxidase, central domain
MTRRMKPGIVAALFAVAVVAVGSVAAHRLAAAESNAKAKRAVKLNSRIVAMADNSWLKMNPGKEPDGRNYSGCCLADWGQGSKIWYFGGAHNSYAYDDVAFYDIATNTWTPSWKDRRNWMKMNLPGKDKQEKRAARSRKMVEAKRLPCTHTYQQVCWVPERKVFAYLGHLGSWEFDPVTMKWDIIALPLYSQYEGMPESLKRFCPWTRWAVQTHHLYYSPDAQAPVAITTHRPQGDWIYNAKKKQWTRLKRSVGSVGGEIYSTYVPTLKAQILSAGKSGFFLHKMVKDGTGWKTVWTPMKDVPKELIGCKALAYDSTNDVVIALKPGNRKTPVRTFCLDIKTMKWSETKPINPPKGHGLFAPLWYEPDHHAFFFLARTSQTRCETWFYRYKKAEKKSK